MSNCYICVQHAEIGIEQCIKLTTKTVNTLFMTAVELLSSCSVLRQIMLFHHVSLGFFLAFDFHFFWPIPGATGPLDKQILLRNPS